MTDIDAVYAQVPKADCIGRCWDSCTRFEIPEPELERMRERGIEPPAPGEPVEVHISPLGSVIKINYCTKLTAGRRCSIYDDRPLICRLWGSSELMPCNYGCGGEQIPAEETRELIGHLYGPGWREGTR